MNVPMKRGDRYQCIDPRCGCEFVVIKDPASAQGTVAPRCCCGNEMKERRLSLAVGQQVAVKSGNAGKQSQPA